MKLTPAQQRYLDDNNLTYPVLCKVCGKETKWNAGNGRFGIYCSTTCRSNDPDVKNKIKQTSIRKYGVDNVLKSPSIRDYIKQTTMAKYGVEYTTQAQEIKDKRDKVSREQYGVRNNNQRHMKEAIDKLDAPGWLYDEYVTKHKTAAEIAANLNVDASTVGNYLKKQKISIKYTIGYSRMCVEWLESIEARDGITIQHATNGGEYRIPGTRFKVDGYCAETNTVYEFHGDLFHGNPLLYDRDDYCNFFSTKTAGELYDATIAREQEIKARGYKLVVMWESDFKRARLQQK